MIGALRISLIALVSAFYASPLAAQDADRHYGLRYDLTLNPQADRAEVALTLDKRIKGNIWSMRFHIDPERHTGFKADGKLESDGAYVTWTPPESGGRMSFQVPVSHRRDNGRFDAMMTNDWAIFRGDDLFPPARTDQHDAAEADATLHVALPERWSFVSPYSETGDNVLRDRACASQLRPAHGLDGRGPPWRASRADRRSASRRGRATKSRCAANGYSRDAAVESTANS